jgi:hypothetical protein
MAKVVVSSVIVVLLIGSAGLADLRNEQGYGIGLSEQLLLRDGAGEVTDVQGYTVSNRQGTYKIGDGTWGIQCQDGTVAQAGSAVGISENLMVEQDISGGNGLPMARQFQEVEDGCGPLAQIGDMGFVASQSVMRACGPCEGEAVQGIALSQCQAGGNQSLISGQASTLAGAQAANVSGIGDSEGVVVNSAGVAIYQDQFAD